MFNNHSLMFLVLHFIVICIAADEFHPPETLSISFASRFHKTNWRSRALSHGDAVTVFNVEMYGAVGDGIYDNTQAFERAWNAACVAPKAVLLVPRKKIFLVNNLVFQGPCSPGFAFQVEGTIAAPKDPAKWNKKDIWLTFQQLQSFQINGSGTINADGSAWWEGCREEIHTDFVSCKFSQRPVAVHFGNCSRVTVTGLTITNSPNFHLTFNDCEAVKIRALIIFSPEYSPNTDGIDIGTSKHFDVRHCIVSTGDDCMALGNGSSHILIKNLTCGPGHGISIGSLGKFNSSAMVSTIHIDGARMTGTQNGVRIKTWQGGSGMVKDIQFKNVEMINVNNPIIIDQYYCADTPNLCRNQTSAVQINGVTFINITGTSASQVAVKFACSDTIACGGILMKDISLKLSSGGQASSFCENAHGITRGDIFPPSCLKN
ncbi:hypothetical protein SUGI_0122220 [Cryptomeria japonica]|uniref:polygalacturonase n=1 Tax=Cryptomeria japonica TaxID=3369 RepID=UPI002408CC96|nr:polygalacturonase [Cryptomeria japonica]GLJ10104.1 hypothetical protein SUGI_0122220 [Cryptomeria japonica]